MVLALLLLQETVHIARNDDRKPLYEAFLRRYAEIRLDDPKRAVESLDALIADVRDGPVECRIRVERMANVFSDPVDFLPYQLRGRARLAIGGRASLLAAERDLEASVARKAASSGPYLEKVRAALWDDVRPDLGVDRWTPEAVALARRLKPAWADDEAKRAVEALDALSGAPEEKHAAARRALAWCDAVGDAAKAVREKADLLLARRSRFRLQIVVTPFAELSRVTRDGKDVELDVRHTPLALSLEAGAYEIELTHPRWGARPFRFRTADVKDGGTYVLSGDMEAGGLGLRELAR
ncbi:MAG TPA: hypothetical protein VF950_26370 [Planctomycetota bacterium]